LAIVSIGSFKISRADLENIMRNRILIFSNIMDSFGTRSFTDLISQRLACQRNILDWSGFSEKLLMCRKQAPPKRDTIWYTGEGTSTAYCGGSATHGP